MELIAGYTALQIGVALGAALVAAFIRGLAGFGLAILIVPVLALALTPVEAVLVTNFVALFLGLLELQMMRQHAERSALTIGLLVLLTTAPGLILLAATPPDLARLLIAMVALSAFGAVLFPVRPETVPGPVATGAVGVTSGLLTGFAGMPGPPVVPYYVGRAIPRQVAKASMVTIFTVAAFAGLAAGLAIGVLEWRLLGLALLLFPTVLLGNWLGSLAFGRVSDAVWRGFTGIVLAAAAIAALVKLLQ
ncbi:sulfite exporter TauE/SafE family protein [Parerythrobacter jejuensis]|uniref:Probable membrane transporter protein n=1 Tax=Parerythrobacter jejuensis TaxID=795812 RepID=A0A845AXC6_9SPHN|nr:sulfite exporter TauE/SafE family protein [Parerythrobacter jejuensis]MXP31073.1 TSUP family transporter [Parerythrobacter jejuensis]MXP33833.1 TSUP family transporter [Parerythrobacter jejuensis]